MLTLLKNIPMAMCGLILGLVSLGNLLVNLGAVVVGNVVGIIGMLLMMIVLMKVILTFTSVQDELMNPFTAGTLPTFTMALMIIAVFWARWGWSTVGLSLWWLALITHVILMIAFCYVHFMAHRISATDIYPSWFVMFVGIGVIPVTATPFSPATGRLFLVLALGLYAIVFPIVMWRLFWHRRLAENALPYLMIIAAPASLCLTGYLNMTPTLNVAVAVGLALFAQALYVITVGFMVRLYVIGQHSLIRFYPSFAALTFPLVISATGFLTLLKRLGVTGQWWNIAANVELGVAFIMVMFVLGHYLRFLVGNVKTVMTQKRSVNE
ncbi:TDT family transporter [Furfurilactobacillus entadae]|uniref:TDT family transporter n=1 Tax=Furfurilactobacillus entadae TaxID=2922307 RepID=UPI0035ED1DBC